MIHYHLILTSIISLYYTERLCRLKQLMIMRASDLISLRISQLITLHSDITTHTVRNSLTAEVCIVIQGVLKAEALMNVVNMVLSSLMWMRRR